VLGDDDFKASRAGFDRVAPVCLRVSSLLKPRTTTPPTGLLLLASPLMSQTMMRLLTLLLLLLNGSDAPAR
jgi:hypothetical protein